MNTSSLRLIQVVAQLKPSRCGVSDQALLLARELESAFGIGSAFVILNSAEECNSHFPRIHCDPSHLLESCISLSDGKPGAILVHYSGYGYSADGAPNLLAEALERVRKSGQFRIAAYFHELYAVGMPWRSAFWHTQRQKSVVRRISRVCDLVATNLNHHADWLDQKALSGVVTPLKRLPVFSNIGEKPELAPMSARRPVVAVFGLPGTRKRSYQRLAHLKSMLATLGVVEILDIGPEFEAPSSLRGVPVKRMGVLSAEEIAILLARTMFGFVPNAPFCLAKSSVLACFCALGTIPVLAESFSGEIDGLSDGVQVVSPRTAKAAFDSGLERCSAAAWRWYSGHRLHIHAGTYAHLLFNSSPEAGTIVPPIAAFSER